ncbi:UvrD-helicase domain-containing protein [Leptospira sp. 2 VSF19]|uniref:DNA 3'-5' helicase n=1 Tax=Leptospira soteropolitanensis TaxID=2950025 RepID=A0AAW5VEH9_9LEPT|nr:UvrD-helicase domain-containing protein [Leptospira soteropolitanensis]MCW7493696.1 UvrD-helicase domain-containing protein [Leptospira soteropolitanensis]MCW7501294.1 UvrD-helicase domain-containing protein [Leptospira soteropolitanensis]MCW7523520.1 UvrD-helicase domain-containing protein [Leptospira soteropolitanensis]MCW7527408.1 UvrD-helicase domain-containing protein [Leptospira soteropolitanensis]MCW7531264.1 UvrD-helicase domain-containing protein [Leptospira soteropolitanensis]
MWSEEQKSIIKSEHLIKQVIAGAGSGKTATMVGLLEEREKQNSILPENTLVVTFTKKATHEFKERCQKKGLSSRYHISTFHAFCYYALKHFDNSKNWSKFKLLSQSKKWKITKELLNSIQFEIGGVPFPILFKNDAKHFKEISLEKYHTFSRSFQWWKDKNNYFEFDDLIFDFLKFLDSESSNTVKNRWKALIIDEFQDTDEVQLQIIKKMNFKSITVVGDDWQAIYGFRGATPKPFLEFPNHFPNVVQFFLSTNYRSNKSIIESSLLPLKKNKEKITKQVKTFRTEKGIFQVERIKDTQEDPMKIWNEWYKKDSSSIILTRSNFRKHEWIENGVPALQVMTIHSAKGLEFRTVLLDLVLGWSEDIEDIDEAEERRILYVGLSRAKDNLVLLIPDLTKPKRLADRMSEDFSIRNRFRNRTLRWARLW